MPEQLESLSADARVTTEILGASSQPKELSHCYSVSHSQRRFSSMKPDSTTDQLFLGCCIPLLCNHKLLSLLLQTQEAFLHCSPFCRWIQKSRQYQSCLSLLGPAPSIYLILFDCCGLTHISLHNYLTQKCLQHLRAALNSLAECGYILMAKQQWTHRLFYAL